MANEIDSILTRKLCQPTIKRMNLKQQLKFFLKERGMTAAELSRKSGVSKQVISLWLSGSKPRNIEQVKKAAEVLGTSVDNLCFGNGISKDEQRITELDALVGDQWISGLFEVRLRRVRKS